MYCQTKKEGGKELFYFNKADIYTEHHLNVYILLTDGKIMYDIRIGSYKYWPQIWYAARPWEWIQNIRG